MYECTHWNKDLRINLTKKEYIMAIRMLDENEQQILLNLRGTHFKSKDGQRNTQVLWTDTRTGVITLGNGEKTDLVSLCIVFDVPDEVWDV